MKIAFLNQKGGAGKTTVASLVASALKDVSKSLSIAIEDLDDVQLSLTWWAKNVGNFPLLSECQNADIIITDTPGHLDMSQKKTKDKFINLIKEADRLVIVSGMSLISLKATLPMADLIKEFKRPDAKAKLLLNQVRVSTPTGKQEMHKITKHLGVQLLDNWLPLASAYEVAYSKGWKSVLGKERLKINHLATEILS